MPAVEWSGQGFIWPYRHQNVEMSELDPPPPKFMPASLGAL
jgi:hypothetical protein